VSGCYNRKLQAKNMWEILVYKVSVRITKNIITADDQSILNKQKMIAKNYVHDEPVRTNLHNILSARVENNEIAP